MKHKPGKNMAVFGRVATWVDAFRSCRDIPPDLGNLYQQLKPETSAPEPCNVGIVSSYSFVVLSN